MSVDRLRQLATHAHAQQRGSVRVPLAVLDRALRSLTWMKRRHSEQQAELDAAIERISRLTRTLEAERIAFAGAVAKLKGVSVNNHEEE